MRKHERVTTNFQDISMHFFTNIKEIEEEPIFFFALVLKVSVVCVDRYFWFSSAEWSVIKIIGFILRGMNDGRERR